jgi:hypothetical protein
MSRERFVASAQLAAIGAVVAGTYGAVHDQVSFTISPEYFTKLKFEQFAWADAGWPARVFVSVVGALGSWWVGLIAGWVLGRVGFADPARVSLRRDVARAFGIVLGAALVFGVAGAFAGVVASRGDLTAWGAWHRERDVSDLPSFVIVAWLHNASYLGGALGLVAAVLDARRRSSRGRSQLSQY